MGPGPMAGRLPPLRVGAVTLDLARRRASVADREVILTKTEFEVLAHLMRRQGHVCTRQELMFEVWGYPVTLGSRTVDVHVAQLRSKLGAALRIRTVRGVGYGVEPLAGST